MKIIGRNWINPPPGPGWGAAWSRSNAVRVMARGIISETASGLRERQRPRSRRDRRPGGVRPLPEPQEVLPEDPAHLGLGVPAPEELLRDHGELRDVLQPVGRVLDPVAVGPEAGGSGPPDPEDPLDVVDHPL